MSSRHFLDWATADWLGSRVRLESIMTARPMLRLLYLEAIFQLHASGRALPGSTDELVPLLGLPADVIEAELPRLLAIGSIPGSRAGLVRLEDGSLTNRRIEEDRAAEADYRARKADAGRRGGERSAGTRRERYGTAQPRSTAEAPLRDSRSTTSGESKQDFEPAEAPSKPPFPFPVPSPFPAPAPVAGARSVAAYLDALEEAWPVSPLPLRVGAERAINERLDDLPDLDVFSANVKAWARSDGWQRGFRPTNVGRWITDGGADSPPPGVRRERRDLTIEDHRHQIIDRIFDPNPKPLTQAAIDQLVERAKAADSLDQLRAIQSEAEAFRQVAS